MSRPDRALALLALAAGLALWLVPEGALAQGARGLGLELAGKSRDGQEVSGALKILLALTLLALIPGILVAMTAFTRIIIVLSMLRQALGMQETPPNMVLVSLALFLTLFTMLPVVKEINDSALGPYLGDKISIQEAGTRAIEAGRPLRPDRDAACIARPLFVRRGAVWYRASAVVRSAQLGDLLAGTRSAAIPPGARDTRRPSRVGLHR